MKQTYKDTAAIQAYLHTAEDKSGAVPVINIHVHVDHRSSTGSGQKPDVQTANSSAQILKIVSGKKVFRIPYDSILAAQADGHYINVHTITETKRIRASFTALKGSLSDPRFICINKGTLVNLDHVIQISEGNVLLGNGMTFSVRKGGYKKAAELYLQYRFGGSHSVA